MTFPTIISITILCLAGLYSAQKQDLQIKADLNEAHLRLEGAIDKSKTKLARVAIALSADKSLTYSLSKKNWKTAGRIIGRYQNSQSISDIKIYDSNCKKLTGITLRYNEVSCKTHRNKPNKYITTWPKKLAFPTLNHVSKIRIEKESYYIQLTAALNKNWLALYPNLYTLMQTSSLKITRKDQDGYSAIRRIAGLGSKAFLSQLDDSGGLLITKPTTYSGTIHKLISLCLLFALVMCFFTIIKIRKLKQTRADNLEYLLQWGQSLVAKSYGDITLPHTIKGDFAAWPEIENFLDGLTQILSEYSKTMKSKDAKYHSSIKSIAELKEQVSMLSSEIGEIPLLQSLAHQINSEIEQIESDTVILDHITTESESILKIGCLPQIQALQKSISRWQEGCRTNTPRKFLRSLSEQQSPEANYQNRLDFELAVVVQSCNQIVSSALQLNLHHTKSRKKVQKISDRIQLWKLLSDREQNIGGAEKIRPALASSINILETADRNHSYVEKIIEDTDADVDHLNIPSFIWQAMFYHILRCFELHSPIMLKHLTLKIIEKENQQNMIFCLRGDLEKGANLEPASKKHLEICSIISRSLPVEVRKLPNLEKNLLICITWALDGQGVAIDTEENESASKTPGESQELESYPAWNLS